MKYIVLILAGGLLFGLILTLGIYALFGYATGLAFAKTIAGPLGMALAFVVFLVYDHFFPWKK